MYGLALSIMSMALSLLLYMDGDYISRRMGDWFNGAALVLFLGFLF